MVNGSSQGPGNPFAKLERRSADEAEQELHHVTKLSSQSRLFGCARSACGRVEDGDNVLDMDQCVRIWCKRESEIVLTGT